MLRTVKTLFGHNINDGSSYTAALLNPNELPAAKPVFVEQSEADSQDAGTYTVDIQTLAVAIRIRNYASRVTLAAQLKAWVKRGEQGNLVVTYGDDSADYAKSCRILRLIQDPNDAMSWTAMLQSGDTAWKAVTAETDSWNETGTGGTKSIDVGGDDETYLTFEITPSAAPTTKYLYSNLYRLAGVGAQTYGMRPWCIEVDTATLVAAGKMRADCYDLRILVSGAEVHRWIDSPNAATTKVWFNLNMRSGVSLALTKAVANPETITVLQFARDVATVKKIASLPKSGLVYHGTEWIAYSNTLPSAGQLVVSKRGALNTALQAHLVGDAFLFIPADIKMLYGKSAATDPSLDDANYDDDKPPFDLNASTNTSWVYTASTTFYDPTKPGRLGQFMPYLKRLGDVSELYTTVQNVAGNPALGMQVGTWLKGVTPQNESILEYWSFYSPIGINTVTATGRKWRNTLRWPTLTGCQRSMNGTTWTTVWAETKPGSASSWTALGTHSGVSVSSNKWIRFVMSGGFAALTDALSLYEIDTVTITYPSANVPVGAFLGEAANYSLEITLQNNANGDALEINYPMRQSKTLAVDGEAFTALYDEISVHDAVVLDDPSRPYFIRLQPGANELELVSEDCGTVDIALSWYPRRL